MFQKVEKKNQNSVNNVVGNSINQLISKFLAITNQFIESKFSNISLK